MASCGSSGLLARSRRNVRTAGARSDWYSDRWYRMENGSGTKAGSCRSEARARWSSAVRLPRSRADSKYAPMVSRAMAGGSVRASSGNAGRSTNGPSAVGPRASTSSR